MSIEKKYLKTKPICKVKFILEKDVATEAKKVSLVGDFNGWDPTATTMTDNGDSTYFAWIQVEQFTDTYYKFINGNSWGNDESVPTDCGVDDGNGNINAVR